MKKKKQGRAGKSPPNVKPEERVYARGGRYFGRLTGGSKKCMLEGCPGHRLGVRWADGKITWPCNASMKVRRGNALQIG